MKRGPIAALKKMRDDKRQWRAHVARTKKLPPSYRLVMEEIQKFMWNFAWDDTMVHLRRHPRPARGGGRRGAPGARGHR